MEDDVVFAAERPRLVRLAARVLGDPTEAEDVVQQAWLRLHANAVQLQNLPGWLTTVTTRLCLDRLRARVPLPVEDVETDAAAPDPADDIALADTVGIALQVVLDRLSPAERVAFVLHDSFGFDFATIAEMLETSPAAARKLASRARAKVAQPAPQDSLSDWEVVEAFLAAARHGEFDRLLALLAPDAQLSADAAAIALGTPTRISGAAQVAEFFNGAAKAAVAAFVHARPGAAWFHRGEAKVAFDFTIADAVVRGVVFRAEPDTLRTVHRRNRDGLSTRPAT
ncbi:sigma-70 family RNA polymerase sigma factor [uncultured Jatrophihabitans sp.]|uniref:sigma-70 family RNA polymerase sigma factor n=1 Tax=uncultured Jatrophihabitans sp. TaxID=1610747 RepID=UPI0035CA89C7